MRKRRRKIVVRVVSESRCNYVVNYTAYHRGYHTKSQRRGRCSRWTWLECGLCRVHHRKMNHSAFSCKAMYKDVEAM